MCKGCVSHCLYTNLDGDRETREIVLLGVYCTQLGCHDRLSGFCFAVKSRLKCHTIAIRQFVTWCDSRGAKQTSQLFAKTYVFLNMVFSYAAFRLRWRFLFLCFLDSRADFMCNLGFIVSNSEKQSVRRYGIDRSHGLASYTEMPWNIDCYTGTFLLNWRVVRVITVMVCCFAFVNTYKATQLRCITVKIEKTVKGWGGGGKTSLAFLRRSMPKDHFFSQQPSHFLKDSTRLPHVLRRNTKTSKPEEPFHASNECVHSSRGAFVDSQPYRFERRQ